MTGKVFCKITVLRDNCKLLCVQPEMKWSPELMRRVIKSYGDAEPTQKVTVGGQPTDIAQLKEVDRWEANSHNEIGEIWYDLNIDGLVCDLTATFGVVLQPEGLRVRLRDIHVM